MKHFPRRNYSGYCLADLELTNVESHSCLQNSFTRLHVVEKTIYNSLVASGIQSYWITGSKFIIRQR